MIFTGAFLFVFLLLHLKTFKFGPWYETVENGVIVRDLYRLVIEVFQSPGYVVFYVVGMAIVFLHLRHGVSSAFQSLGVEPPALQPADPGGRLRLRDPARARLRLHPRLGLSHALRGQP